MIARSCTAALQCQTALGELTRGSLHPIDCFLVGEPAHEITHAFLEGDHRAEAEQRLAATRVRVAMANVARAVLANDLA